MMPMMPQSIPQMGHNAYATIGAELDGKTPPADVNLRQAEEPSISCATCTSFMPPTDCAVVAGKVADNMLCDAYSADEDPDNPTEEMM